ncbi:dipicolinate synthase subunit DpsA [Virgibacillus salexigens]|uniref:dipicolinate synthase subunit DpsA n=1 Tax=Virgibacillus massiliensis TaxID=1462526 RepID=UPI00136C28EF|nr:dipicolinate synthase subunit DpsA [Virgibacillus massiliensis]MYL42479.1 dipicolinate synthase subunit DpsA [Virgibacillus massiliensis]
MNTNKHVMLLGGDERYLHVIDSLAKAGIRISLIGYEQLSFNEPNIQHVGLDNADFSSLRAIILPVAGTDLKGKIEVTYSDKQVYLTEQLVSCTPKQCVIYSGTANQYLQQIADVTDRKLVKLFARDDIAIYNSIPTAEGTLKLAIEQSDETIHGANVCVLGFGRVGITVARVFSAVGANVSVAARSSAAVARITEMGFHAIPLNQLEKAIGQMTICINTIPSQVVDQSIISAMSPSVMLIDLASKPGGTDFDFALKRGISTFHALGLPGKTAPKSAGKIIATVLLDLLQST